VSIGGALAEARSQAGLTIRQVSERTRIRETIIRDIERDDYSACGGDFYARGHIRAIARVVGADSVPLIAEYDAAHAPPPELEQPGHDAGSNGPGHDRIWHPRQRHDRTGPQRPGQGGPPGPAGSAQVRPAEPGPRGITAAEAFRPAMPLKIRGGRLPRRTGGLALIVLAVIGTLTYLLLSGSGHAPNAAGARSRPGPTRHHTVAPTAHHSASPPIQPVSVQLTPVSAAAFGPAGAGQGDNPALAQLAIANTPGSGWQTDWYSSANFAGLQSGTGLLLDMGKPVTISAAQLKLGPVAGGSLQLRAGNTPTLAGLQPVAESGTAGGTVTLQIASPVSARYLLIWFTSLPPDNSGTYQGFIYGVRLTGTA
jgi:Helix-turn-helix domain